MGRVLVTSSHFETLCQDAKKLLTEAGHEIVVYQGELPYMRFEDIVAIIGTIDGAIIGLDDWTDAVFAHAPRLKVVAKFGVGTDNIDKASAARHGIQVVNAPGLNANAVAELTIGFMIDLLRKITMLHGALKEGRWIRSIGSELSGCTVGLLGFGAISRLVAKKLQGFDMQVLAYDLYPDEEIAAKYGVRLVSSEDIISQSDIVSIHVPSTPETYHLFNDEVFAKMKPGAYLINAARGNIVDTNALLRAIESGRLAGAALDTFESEPLLENNPLLTCGKVICTPHTGAETRETYQRVSLGVAQDVINVLSGGSPKHPVCV